MPCIVGCCPQEMTEVTVFNPKAKGCAFVTRCSKLQEKIKLAYHNGWRQDKGWEIVNNHNKKGNNDNRGREHAIPGKIFPFQAPCFQY